MAIPYDEQKSDIFSYGIILLEAILLRDIDEFNENEGLLNSTL